MPALVASGSAVSLLHVGVEQKVQLDLLRWTMLAVDVEEVVHFLCPWLWQQRRFGLHLRLLADRAQLDLHRLQPSSRRGYHL